jgi:hypothetical protein
MDSKYLIHTTPIHNLPNILKSGKLLISKPSEDSKPGVYTTYLSTNINYEGNGWYYGYWLPKQSERIILCIDTDILNNANFVICPRVMFGKCKPKDIVMTKATLSIESLEKFINKSMEKLIKKQEDLDNLLLSTHEICVEKDIPLKYIKQIIVPQSKYDSVTKIISSTGYENKIKVIKKPRDWRKIF